MFLETVSSEIGQQAVDKLLVGVQEAGKGLHKATVGAQQLADGAVQLNDGTGRLQDASLQLDDGAHRLSEGSDKLAAGTQQLHDQLFAEPAPWRSAQSEAGLYLASGRMPTV